VLALIWFIILRKPPPYGLKNQPQVVLINAGQRKIAHNDLVAKVPKNIPDSIDEQP